MKLLLRVPVKSKLLKTYKNRTFAGNEPSIFKENEYIYNFYNLDPQLQFSSYFSEVHHVSNVSQHMLSLSLIPKIWATDISSTYTALPSHMPMAFNERRHCVRTSQSGVTTMQQHSIGSVSLYDHCFSGSQP